MWELKAEIGGRAAAVLKAFRASRALEKRVQGTFCVGVCFAARRMMRVGATITVRFALLKQGLFSRVFQNPRSKEIAGIAGVAQAAEKFEELQMWEEAADCLVAADRRADARSLVSILELNINR